MPDTIYNSNDVEVTKYDKIYEFEQVSDGSLVDINANDAASIAQAILKTEGVAQDAVLASEVSFNEALFRLAAAHGKTVEFRYAKGKGKVIETRTLKPEAVNQVGDHLTFQGYDPDRDDVRAYRLDRVKGEVTIR